METHNSGPQLPFTFNYKGNVINTEKELNPKCSTCKGLGYTGKLVGHQPRVPAGRNSKCICDSGKKFKNCCLEKIENMRRETNTLITCKCMGMARLSINDEQKNALEEYLKLARENQENG
jgi:hypothetical protein